MGTRTTAMEKEIARARMTIRALRLTDAWDQEPDTYTATHTYTATQP